MGCYGYVEIVQKLSKRTWIGDQIISIQYYSPNFANSHGPMCWLGNFDFSIDDKIIQKFPMYIWISLKELYPLSADRILLAF